MSFIKIICVYLYFKLKFDWGLVLIENRIGCYVVFFSDVINFNGFVFVNDYVMDMKG